MYKGKYIKLYEFLQEYSSKDSSLTLTVNEVEEILQFKLPDSARKYSAWWSNEENGNHTHAKAWLFAGWNTIDVKLGVSVTFQRIENQNSRNQSVNAAIGEYMVLAELLKRNFSAFLAHGPNQADWDIIISSQQSIKKVQVKAIDWPKNRAVNITSYQKGKFDVLVIVLINKPESIDQKKDSQFLIMPDSDIENFLSKYNKNRTGNARTITVNKNIIKTYENKWSLI